MIARLLLFASLMSLFTWAATLPSPDGLPRPGFKDGLPRPGITMPVADGTDPMPGKKK